MESSFYYWISSLEKDSLFGGNSFSSLSFLEVFEKDAYNLAMMVFFKLSFFEDNYGELVGLKPTQMVSNIQMNKDI